MTTKSHIVESIVPRGSVVKCLLKKLEETGTEVALIDCPSGEIWSGHKVHDAVLRCTSALMEIVGLKRGDVVCVYAANSAIHSIAYISLLGTGAVLTGCSPNVPLRELLNMIVDTDARYVICSPENINITQQSIEECGRKMGLLVFADNDVTDSIGTVTVMSINKLLKYENKFTPVDVTDDHIATLVPSSGSTGTPKYIIHTHKTLKNMAVQGHHDEVFGQIKGSDVFSGHITIHCEVGCFALLHSICSNVPIALQPEFDADLYGKYVDKYKITSAFIVPTYLIMLVNSPMFNGCDLSSLINVVSGGYRMPDDLPDRIRTKMPALKLRPCYGSTKTGFITIVHKKDSRAGSAFSTVGKPFPGVTIKIIDPKTEEVQPIGKIGEICVSSNTVTPGYYNSPQSDKNLFVGETFFRTGDAGYFDTDGNLYVSARIKDIIKVGAYQVAPLELEMLLMSHEDVLEAAVIGVSHEVYVEVPKAFVILKSDRICGECELIEFIKDRVDPIKQLRGGIEFLNDFPRSSLGKVRKSKLKLGIVSLK